MSCLVLAIGFLGCEPAGVQAPADDFEQEGVWATTPSGALTYVTKDRLCLSTSIEVPEGTQVFATEDGTGFVFRKASLEAQSTEPATLKCKCTNGDATKCTPLWYKGEATCTVSEGCTDCKRIFTPKKKKKSANKLAPKKLTWLVAEESLVAVTELQQEATALAVEALERAITRESMPEQGCSDFDVDPVRFEQERADLIQAIYGYQGMPVAFMNGVLPQDTVYVEVKIAKKVAAIPVKRSLAALVPGIKEVPKPTACTCDKVKKDPKPKKGATKLGMTLSAKKEKPACKLDSSWGVHYCENEKCAISCNMVF